MCDTHQHKSRACMRHTTARVQLIRMRQCVLCVAGIVCGLARWLRAYIPPFPALFVSADPPIPGTQHIPTNNSTALPLVVYADNKISRFSSLKILSSQKRVVHNRRYFLGTLRRPIFCFKFKKNRFQRLVPKNAWSLF
jgi:hypothetical protein